MGLNSITFGKVISGHRGLVVSTMPHTSAVGF